MVVGVNLGLTVSIVLIAEQRIAEIEHRVVERMEVTMAAGNSWQTELATARSELGEAVAVLRNELADLSREVSAADDGALRGGLDALGGRVSRIESMIMVLWRTPGLGAQEGIN